jgi:hypothetical protein
MKSLIIVTSKANGQGSFVVWRKRITELAKATTLHQEGNLFSNQ